MPHRHRAPHPPEFLSPARGGRAHRGRGHPLVYNEGLGAPGKPTVLFYGHYDVKPVDPIEIWRHPPFEPTIEGDKLVARGATDDKGQSYAPRQGSRGDLAERSRLPVNVKVIIEGEEKAGGHAIDRYVGEDGGKRDLHSGTFRWRHGLRPARLLRRRRGCGREEMRGGSEAADSWRARWREGRSVLRPEEAAARPRAFVGEEGGEG